MEYFTETGESHSKVLDKVRLKYGEGARILTHRTVRIPGFLGLFSREGVEVQGYVQSPAVEQRKSLDLEEEKRKIIAQARSDQAREQLQRMVEDIASIKEALERREGTETGTAAEHQTLAKVRELLDLNDFSPSFRDAILSRARKEFSLEDLEDFWKVQDAVVMWIAESISVASEPAPPGREARVIVLVGPTGVGKTTTIAKLAASYKFKKTPSGLDYRIRIATIDNFRVGAEQQMASYAGIMEIPFSSVTTQEDLRKVIDAASDGTDVILVDTIGKNPRDSVELAEMKRILEACGRRAETHLAISASVKTSDMRETMRQFEPFGYSSVIVTKIDETTHSGNAISVLAESGKPVSFVTTGQKVPFDIERGGPMPFLLALEGFRLNRIELDARFPSGEAARKTKTKG